jgi:exodeoxyribonuclease VII small subunit
VSTDPTPGAPPAEGEPGYADALAELEEILDELEADVVDVDRLAERVRRASTLIRLCRGRIAAARLQVESVVADLEQLEDPGPS